MFNFNHNITWYLVPRCAMYNIISNTHLAHTRIQTYMHACIHKNEITGKMHK